MFNEPRRLSIIIRQLFLPILGLQIPRFTLVSTAYSKRSPRSYSSPSLLTLLGGGCPLSGVVPSLVYGKLTFSKPGDYWLIQSNSLLYVAVYVKVGHPADDTVISASTAAGGKGAIAFILLFAIFYCMGWNGLAWVSRLYSLTNFLTLIRSLKGHMCRDLSHQHSRFLCCLDCC